MKTLILTFALLLLPGQAWAEGWGALGRSDIAVKTIAMEASNQDDYGRYLVASVIVNRASERYGTWESFALDKVCLEHKQFSCWNGGKWARAWLGSFGTPKALGRAENGLKQAIRGPYQRIDHYHTNGVRPYWAKGKRPIIKYGEHWFYDLE